MRLIHGTKKTGKKTWQERPSPGPTIPKKQETNIFVSEEYGLVNEAKSSVP
jgi:hypothetical protein